MLNGRGGPREVKQFTDFFQLFFESRSAGKYFQAKKKLTLSVKLGFINEKVLCRASLQFITIFGDWGWQPFTLEQTYTSCAIYFS